MKLSGWDNKMSVNSITNANNFVLQPAGGQQMGQSDFLRLMTAQLSHQDPFNPVDNQQMVAQMAQFSSLAGINDTNSALAKISEQLTAQTELLKDIKAATPAPTPATN
jgi:flagellar basal-body rod modification protein FlgD